MVKVTSIILKRVIPTGWPDPKNDFEVQHSELDIENANLKGGIAVKTLYVSVDPYQRPKMTGVASYTEPYVPGEPLYSDAVVKVLRSDHKKFPVGSVVVGYFRWQTYGIVPASILASPFFNVVPSQYKLPVSAWIGPAGMAGRTAFVGLELADPKPGETIYVSAAAGAVGQIVGGLALQKGLKVIGSAGSDDKVKYLVDELGFDPASFNYKKIRTRDALKPWLKSLGKKGLDIYFDNVGGEMLDDSLAVSADFGRFILCGAVSQYNVEKPSDRYGLRNTQLIVSRRLQVKGFIVSDQHEKRLPAFYAEVPKLLAEGKLKFKESKTTGLENAPQALVDMLKGLHFGKAVVQVAEDADA